MLCGLYGRLRWSETVELMAYYPASSYPVFAHEHASRPSLPEPDSLGLDISAGLLRFLLMHVPSSIFASLPHGPDPLLGSMTGAFSSSH